MIVQKIGSNLGVRVGEAVLECGAGVRLLREIFVGVYGSFHENHSKNLPRKDGARREQGEHSLSVFATHFLVRNSKEKKQNDCPKNRKQSRGSGW